jgi:hypothetical protein
MRFAFCIQLKIFPFYYISNWHYVLVTIVDARIFRNLMAVNYQQGIMEE